MTCAYEWIFAVESMLMLYHQLLGGASAIYIVDFVTSGSICFCALDFTAIGRAERQVKAFGGTCRFGKRIIARILASHDVDLYAPVLHNSSLIIELILKDVAAIERVVASHRRHDVYLTRLTPSADFIRLLPRPTTHVLTLNCLTKRQFHSIGGLPSHA